jgi:hypothetical protein
MLACSPWLPLWAILLISPARIQPGAAVEAAGHPGELGLDVEVVDLICKELEASSSGMQLLIS